MHKVSVPRRPALAFAKHGWIGIHCLDVEEKFHARRRGGTAAFCRLAGLRDSPVFCLLREDYLVHAVSLDYDSMLEFS